MAAITYRGMIVRPTMAAPRRLPLARGRFLIRPCGLAGSRWEPAAAGLYSVALGGVFGSEILTPDDVLTALSLPPLLAAVWTLSGRLAAAVSALAVSLFAIVLIEEAPNRLTILSIGLAGVVLAVAVRAYAASLDQLLETARRGRAARSVLPTLAATTARLSGLDSLTRREVEVARLASDGYMASEIAVSLQISARTVESHLAHVYAKLGVTSRRELMRISGLSGKIDQ